MILMYKKNRKKHECIFDIYNKVYIIEYVMIASEKT